MSLQNKPAAPTPDFEPGQIVKIDDGYFEDITGIVFGGPDSDNDYKVGYLNKSGDPDWGHFGPDDLKLAA
jgi:hypothetical protein